MNQYFQAISLTTPAQTWETFGRNRWNYTAIWWSLPPAKSLTFAGTGTSPLGTISLSKTSIIAV
jgi:hypothetical protein